MIFTPNTANLIYLGIYFAVWLVLAYFFLYDDYIEQAKELIDKGSSSELSNITPSYDAVGCALLVGLLWPIILCLLPFGAAICGIRELFLNHSKWEINKYQLSKLAENESVPIESYNVFGPSEQAAYYAGLVEGDRLAREGRDFEKELAKVRFIKKYQPL